MEKKQSAHVVPHKMYGLILLVLICLTFMSVAVTSIELASLTVFIALSIAAVKGILVLTFFMHLKFDNLILRIMVAAIFLLLGLVMFVTFLDYNYR